MIHTFKLQYYRYIQIAVRYITTLILLLQGRWLQNGLQAPLLVLPLALAFLLHQIFTKATLACNLFGYSIFDIVPGA